MENGAPRALVPPERRPRCAVHAHAAETTCLGCGLFLCDACGAGSGERCRRCRGEAHPIPWEDPSLGVLRAFARTLRAVSRPNRFFAESAWSGGLRRPLGFAVLAATLGGAGKALTAYAVSVALGSGGFLAFLQGIYGRLPGMDTPRGRAFLGEQLPALLGSLDRALSHLAATQFLSTPLEAVLEVFVLAALTLPVARRLGGRGSFEATFRALAYANAAQVLKLIPLLGLPLAALGGLLLTVVGLRRAHGITGGRALLAALWWVPLLLLGVGLLLACFAAAAVRQAVLPG